MNMNVNLEAVEKEKIVIVFMIWIRLLGVKKKYNETAKVDFNYQKLSSK